MRCSCVSADVVWCILACFLVALNMDGLLVACVV